MEEISMSWNYRIRLFILQMVFVILCGFLLHRLWELQIVDGEQYARDYELKITRTVRDNHTRGIIYDCNGEVLAYNELVYTVTMIDDGEYASRRERQLSLNGMIYRVIRKLAGQHEKVNHELKIEVGLDGDYEYTVTGNALLRFQADVFGKADINDMTTEQRNMSAKEMVNYLAGNEQFGLYGEGKERYLEEELQAYGLPEEYSKDEMLAMVGIRYMLLANAYRKYVPVTIARDVSEETAAYIMENNQLLSGVSIGQDWERVYVGGEAFSHILGYIGKISSEELELHADSDKDYTLDSVIGKAGIEQYMEEVLQGIDGERQITVNNVGKIIGEGEILREMESGRDVYLSIDKNMQIAVYDILEKNLAGILADNLINAKWFDKTRVTDTTDIRIPIYDVYMALVNNNVIRLQDMDAPDATALEKEVSMALQGKFAEAMESLRIELLDGDVDYLHLSEEIQEYIAYLINESGLIKEDAVDKEDELYRKWRSGGSINIKDFLANAVNSGWIAEKFIDSGQRYLSMDEMYGLLMEGIEKELGSQIAFRKLLFKWLAMEEKITGRDICLLLYAQEVLSDMDDDYDKMVSGETDAFSFLKKKIVQLEITPAMLALDPCSASAVAVNPENGKVLALVSYPGYDNNRLANQMDAAYYSQLLNDASLPLYNRATQQLTAPGSTFKPVTVVAGIQEGAIRPETSFFCDGVFDKVEPSLKCWKHSGHGNVSNAQTALQFSCNDYLCEIAYRFGVGESMEYTDSEALHVLQEYAGIFYLDEKSGVEIVESKPQVTDAYAIPSAIGQGTHNYTTVQLARYVNIIASRGNAFPLSLIKGVSDESGNFKEGKNMSDETVELPDVVWDTVSLGMEQFAQNNAAFRDMGISVAGKTGTAQESKSRPDHALFVGYAPADNAKITIAVRIANGYGSSNVTTIGREIFDYYFGLEATE